MSGLFILYMISMFGPIRLFVNKWVKFLNSGSHDNKTWRPTQTWNRQSNTQKLTSFKLDFISAAAFFVSTKTGNNVKNNTRRKVDKSWQKRKHKVEQHVCFIRNRKKSTKEEERFRTEKLNIWPADFFFCFFYFVAAVSWNFNHISSLKSKTWNSSGNILLLSTTSARSTYVTHWLKLHCSLNTEHNDWHTLTSSVWKWQNATPRCF